MTHSNKPDKEANALSAEDEKKLKTLIYQVEEEQKKHLSRPDMLRNHKEVDWLDWIDDMLVYDIAYPDTFRRSSIHDGIMEVSSYFESNNLPSDEYQKALLTTVCGIINLETQNPDVSKKLYRLLNALNGFVNNCLGQKLTEMFFDPKYDNTVWYDHIIKKNVYFKTNMLLILSNSNLVGSSAENVLTQAYDYLQNYVETQGFVYAYLIFTIRQFSKDSSVFFVNLIHTINATKKEMFENLMPIIIDLLESYKFSNNAVFKKGFKEWYIMLCNSARNAEFNTKIEKYLL